MVISGRNEPRLRETLMALHGGEHRAIAADLTDRAQVEALVSELEPLDGLFVSSGVAKLAPFRAITEPHIEQLMGVDFIAPVLLIQRLLKAKRIQDGASIVLNTAASSILSPPGTAIYSAAKAALDAAARSLASEVARNKIRVNSIHFGYVQTEMLEGLARSGMAIEQLAALAPLGVGLPTDAACSAIYLLSDASRWISRITLTCDGGIGISVP